VQQSGAVRTVLGVAATLAVIEPDGQRSLDAERMAMFVAPSSVPQYRDLWQKVY
jgi:hypothetical protein